jgi:hypothetical protein
MTVLPPARAAIAFASRSAIPARPDFSISSCDRRPCASLSVPSTHPVCAILNSPVLHGGVCSASNADSRARLVSADNLDTCAGMTGPWFADDCALHREPVNGASEPA